MSQSPKPTLITHPAPSGAGVGAGSPRNFRPRLRTRTMSVENTSLTEVITIYEKLKKTKEELNLGGGSGSGSGDVFRPSIYTFDFADIEEDDVEETAPLEPFRFGGYGTAETGNTQKVLNFNKYKGMKSSKYLYFSAQTGLVQADSVQELVYRDTISNNDLNYVKLLKSKQYWLNIIDPSEKDLALLGSAYQIHDLTLRDIREGNTEEKIEVYKHYTFMSLRLLSELDTHSNRSAKRRSHRGSEDEHVGNNGNDDTVFLNVEDDKADNISIPSAVDVDEGGEGEGGLTAEDVDFNILLFSDFIVTVHDKHWSSIKDVLGFLNLLVTYGNSPLSPDWVLFSIFIELAQDAKYTVNYIEPKILNVKISETESPSSSNGGGSELARFQRVLRTNFQYELELYKISRFVKPKMNILKMLMFKCNKRLSSTVVRLLSSIATDFSELLDELAHFSHILERSQDTFLTLANVQQSHEANEMSKVMKRISEIALIFLPVQAIAGFMGMNVIVPFQDVAGTIPFWCTVAFSFVLALVIFTLRKVVLDRKFRNKLFHRK